MEFDPRTGAVSVPVYQVSTFKQEALGRHHGYEYSRTGNPTRQALEELIAALEGGRRGLAFASGMAAISSVLMLFDAGDHLIVSDDVYGGTFRVLDKVFRRFGVDVTFADLSRAEELPGALTARTRAVFVETPTNPLMRVTDLRAVSAFCKGHGLLHVVDNTFMTPYLQRPLELGADLVIHSATKYLGGHSDVVAGLVVVASQELGDRLHFIQNAVGAILGPMDSWLVMRGVKTLGVRMDRQQANAQAITEWLKGRPEVKKVYYPGLPEHPGHALAKKQAAGFGAMVSFELASASLAEHLLNNVRLITLAESLGAVESLICLPARMTHASIPPEKRAARGISDALVRLSAGIEDVKDLIADLARALGTRPE
ncbi:MAG: PLP-dependent transferase [Firmicutes bacterium]|nr:PLP-dependent transferase [Bacillota bacterium]